MGGTVDAYRWAVGIPYVETAFSTQILDANLTSWIEIASADFAKIEKTFRTNRGQINGTRGATSYQIETAMGTLAWKFDLSTEAFTWLLVIGLGNLTTTSNNATFGRLSNIDSSTVMKPRDVQLGVRVTF